MNDNKGRCKRTVRYGSEDEGVVIRRCVLRDNHADEHQVELLNGKQLHVQRTEDEEYDYGE